MTSVNGGATRRAATCSPRLGAARTGRHTTVVRAILRVLLAAGLAFIPSAALVAQDASAIGQAIAATCGTLPDPETEAVVAGTVVDSVSGVALPRADVRIAWEVDGALDTAGVATDEAGFFAFCSVPAGGEVELLAHLRVWSRPLVVQVDAGMLHVQQLLLPLSDPAKPGELVGRIFDATSRRPIAGADVTLKEPGRHTVTNTHGYFTFGTMPWGVYTLEVENLGYGARTLAVRVAGDLTQIAEIALSEKALELEGLNVTVQRRAALLDVDGLVRRMSVGFGTVLTRDVIERRPNARVTDLLREVPGVLVNKRGYSTSLEVRGRPCAPNVFVDGMPRMWDPSEGLDFFISSEVEAVEVYKGFAEIPGEFIMPGQINPCMAIAIWTRRGQR